MRYRGCKDAYVNQALRCTLLGVTIDRRACKACGRCVQQCPSGALELAGQSKSIAEIVEEVKLDRAYNENSGGGVTLSGGEPLAQPEAALALLDACKQEGFHTAVETCGYAEPEVFDAIRPLVDLYLFDIKAFDAQHHTKGTGRDNQLVLSNFRNLFASGANVVVRVPLIPEYNLNQAFARDLAALVHPLPINHIELIPYHRLGASKYHVLGRSHNQDSIPLANVEAIDQFTERLCCVIPISKF